MRSRIQLRLRTPLVLFGGCCGSFSVPSRSPDDALGAIIAGALGYGGAIAIVAGLTAASGIWSFTTCPPTAARQPRQLRL
jgi:hypothetical protein